MKRLYKSNKNKFFAGIVGGLGEYFEVDPVLLRLGFVVALFFTGIFPGILAYIVAIFLVPSREL